MWDERDLIQEFLEKQSDIRYGNQRDSWHFEPAVELVAHQVDVSKFFTLFESRVIDHEEN